MGNSHEIVAWPNITLKYLVKHALTFTQITSYIIKIPGHDLHIHVYGKITIAVMLPTGAHCNKSIMSKNNDFVADVMLFALEWNDKYILYCPSTIMVLP